jgi:hypothetical protein
MNHWMLPPLRTQSMKKVAGDIAERMIAKEMGQEVVLKYNGT